MMQTDGRPREGSFAKDVPLAALGMALAFPSLAAASAARDGQRSSNEIQRFIVTEAVDNGVVSASLLFASADVESDFDSRVPGTSTAGVMQFRRFLAKDRSGSRADTLIALDLKLSEAKKLGETERALRGEEERLRLSCSSRTAIQRSLNKLGFEIDAFDGQFGSRTRKELKEWQNANGYAATGYLTRGQMERLLAFDREDRARKLSRLLGRELSASAVDEATGWTDLHYAAALDLPQIAKRLLNAGLGANVRLKKGVILGDELWEVLDELRVQDIPRVPSMGGGATPLHWASAANALDVVILLVE